MLFFFTVFALQNNLISSLCGKFIFVKIILKVRRKTTFVLPFVRPFHKAVKVTFCPQTTPKDEETSMPAGFGFPTCVFLDGSKV